MESSNGRSDGREGRERGTDAGRRSAPRRSDQANRRDAGRRWEERGGTSRSRGGSSTSRGAGTGRRYGSEGTSNASRGGGYGRGRNDRDDTSRGGYGRGRSDRESTSRGGGYGRGRNDRDDESRGGGYGRGRNDRDDTGRGGGYGRGRNDRVDTSRGGGYGGGRNDRQSTSRGGSYGRSRYGDGRSPGYSRSRSEDERPERRPRAARTWRASEGELEGSGSFASDEASSLGRAAHTGRNLWTPSPVRGRPTKGSPAPGRSTSTRRSTNTVGGEQVEGRQAVRELLAARRREVREVWLIEGSVPAPILGEIDNLAREAHVPVRMVSPRRLESVQRTETPQGAVAFCDPLESHDLETMVSSSIAATGEGGREVGSGSTAAFLIVVDGVTDPQNLGAILRSAEGAGATGVVLPRHRAVHVTAAVTKAAAGAVEHLPISLVPGIPSALQRLEGLGVLTVGLDERGDTSVYELDLGQAPVALVLGAEGRGLSPLSRRRCDRLANIPLHGHIPSLNVATAAAIACFEVARSRERAVSPKS